MAHLEPLAGEPAAVADLGDELALVIADYHAGIEAALRYDGIELDSQADQRRDRVMRLIADVDADRVIFLGDLAHWIGKPAGAELDEITTLLEAITPLVEVTLIKGNHDGAIEDAVPIEVTTSTGVRFGDIGFVHGHSWPGAPVIEAEIVCMGHEHPKIRLEDEVGGRRIESVWLRAEIEPTVFEDRLETIDISGELVVFPAFNELASGTWINIEGQEFLAPFLPEALASNQVYLLDGTRIGGYRQL